VSSIGKNMGEMTVARRFT